jgi:hypothetical protein
MTRPGRLCRECERELQRARYAGVSLGEIEPTLAAAEASRVVANDWLARLRTPGSAIAVAFAIGVSATVALHIANSSEAAMTHGSVMLDAQQVSHLRQVSVVSASAAADDANPQATSAVEPVRLTAAKSSTPGTRVRVATAVPAIAQAEAGEEPRALPQQVEAHAAPPTLDASHALGDALAQCGGEPFLARPSCEQQARARYCDSAAPLPQCIVPARDYGQ